MERHFTHFKRCSWSILALHTQSIHINNAHVCSTHDALQSLRVKGGPGERAINNLSLLTLAYQSARLRNHRYLGHAHNSIPQQEKGMRVASCGTLYLWRTLLRRSCSPILLMSTLSMAMEPACTVHHASGLLGRKYWEPLGALSS